MRFFIVIIGSDALYDQFVLYRLKKVHVIPQMIPYYMYLFIRVGILFTDTHIPSTAKPTP